MFLLSDGCLSESFGTPSANSVDSDLGYTSSVYLDDTDVTYCEADGTENISLQ